MCINSLDRQGCSVYNIGIIKREVIPTYMKRRVFIKKLEELGFVFDRHGSDHDIYRRGKEKEPVPRHSDIDEDLAKAILKRRGLK